MNRRWLALLLALNVLAIALGGEALRRAKPTASARVPFATTIGSNPNAFWGNARDLLQQDWVNDPVFGAKCDGSSDDSAAIVAADADAKAHGRSVRFPPGTCVTKSALYPSPGVTWQCGSTALGSCTIKAGASLSAAVVTMRSNTGAGWSPSTTLPNTLRGLVVDANGLAPYAVDRQGDWGSTYEHDSFVNATVDCQHASHNITAATIGAVTVGGGGSAGALSVSQPDATYQWISSIGARSVVLKIASTGGLNSATFVASFDGGSTYAIASQVVQSVSELSLTDSTTYEGDTGIRLAWTSRTYVAGETYAFTVTPPTEAGGRNDVFNYNATFTEDTWQNCGAVYGSQSGLAGIYTGFAQSVHASSGSIATTANSQVIQGTGTSWLSGVGVREGDILYDVQGAVYYQIAGALDDSQLVVTPNWVPQSTVSGHDWVISHGAGYWEVSSLDNSLSRVRGGVSRECGVNMRFAGQRGPNVDAVFVGEAATVSIEMSSGLQEMTTGALFSHPYWEDNAVGASNGFVLFADFGLQGATVLEPLDPWVGNVTGGGTATIIQGSNYYPYGGSLTQVTQRVLSFQVEPISVVASTQLTSPNPRSVGSTTTVFRISSMPSGSVESTASPFITQAPFDGVIVRLLNQSGHELVLDQDYVGAVSSRILCDGPYLDLPDGASVELESYAQFWKQITPVVYNYEQAQGANAIFPRSVQTTNATPVMVAQWDVMNAGVSPGTTIQCDVMAQTGEGASDYADWTAITQTWDATGHAIGSWRLDGSHVSEGAGSQWSVAFTTASPWGRLEVTGDSSHTVLWKAVCKTEGPPTTL